MLAEEEPDTRTIEIGVETAEEYRNQGYGLSLHRRARLLFN